MTAITLHPRAVETFGLLPLCEQLRDRGLDVRCGQRYYVAEPAYEPPGPRPPPTPKADTQTVRLTGVRWAWWPV